MSEPLTIYPSREVRAIRMRDLFGEDDGRPRYGTPFGDEIVAYAMTTRDSGSLLAMGVRLTLAQAVQIDGCETTVLWNAATMLVVDLHPIQTIGPIEISVRIGD